jgi:hypothetical protein
MQGWRCCGFDGEEPFADEVTLHGTAALQALDHDKYVAEARRRKLLP